MDIDEHEHFMREALLEGERALIRAEVPVGCVFVHKGEIIASASNRVNELCNATMHAEIVAIEAIAAKSARSCVNQACVLWLPQRPLWRVQLRA